MPAAGAASCNCSNLAYQPVCGKDGFTYSSSCQAACLNVDVAYNGACNKGEWAMLGPRACISRPARPHIAAVQSSKMPHTAQLKVLL
jgi:hypothetical protein